MNEQLLQDMLFTAYVKHMEAEDQSPQEYRSRGEITAIRRIARTIYGREAAAEINRAAVRNAKYIVYGVQYNIICHTADGRTLKVFEGLTEDEARAEAEQLTAHDNKNTYTITAKE